MLRSFFRFLLVLFLGFGIGYFSREIIGEFDLFVRNQEIPLSEETIAIQLQGLQSLESAQMTVQKTVGVEKQLMDLIQSWSIDDTIASFLFQETLEMYVEGVVVAGVDLGSIGSGDIVIYDDGSVSLNIPQAKILHSYLSQETKINDKRLGLFTKGDIQRETSIRNTALSHIEQQALEQGILEIAELNAKRSLKDFLEQTGVIIRNIIVDKPNQKLDKPLQ